MGNQIRTISSGTAVDDAARILSPWVDCSKLIGAPSRPAVFPQERFNVCPSFSFLPRILQGPAPAASGLEVCGRGRVDDHPDGVGAFLTAESKQLGNAPSRRVFLIPSPQSNVELKHGSEIGVESEARTFWKQSTFVPVLSSRQLSFEAAGLISMEFPVAKPCDIDGIRNGRPRRIERLSMSRLQSHVSASTKVN
jgi:hypothetical protein